MKGPNKLERNITLGWKGLSGKNTLAYSAHLWAKRKISVVNKTPGSVLTILHFLNL